MKQLAALILLLGAIEACAEPLTASHRATLREALDDITTAALNQDYQLVKVQPVDSALVKRGFDDPGIRIVFIGNPEQMRHMGKVDAHLLALLPLRLTLRHEGDVVKVSSDDLAPWAEQAANPESRQLVEAWQADLRAILDDYANPRQ